MTLLSTLMKFDSTLFCWCMARKRASEIAKISRLISHLGDGFYYAILGVMLMWLEVDYGSDFFISGIIAFALELPVYFILKNSIRRNRPCDVIAGFEAFLVPSDKFSFPSGHTAAAFVMASLTHYYYPEYGLLAYICAILIGMSRVLLGVHYPGDILAGMILGLASYKFSLLFYT